MEEKNSLERLLFTPISLLVLLAISAAIVGWVSSELVKNAQEQAIDKAVPQFNTARNISFNLSSIITLTPQLLGHQHQAQLSRTHAQLSANIREISRSLEATESQHAITTDSTRLEDINDIAHQIDTLTELIQQRIDVRNRLLTEGDTARALASDIEALIRPFGIDLTDSLLDTTDQIYDNLQSGQTGQAEVHLDTLVDTQLQIESTLDLKSELQKFYSQLDQMLRAETTTTVAEIEQKVALTIRSMIDYALQIDDKEVGSQLAEILNQLFSLLEEGKTISNTATELIALSYAATNSFETLQHKIEAMQLKVENAEKATEANLVLITDYAKKITDNSELILIALVLSSVVLSVYIVRRRIIAAVVSPMTELTHSVDAISKNQFDAPIRDYPIRELAKMSASLSVFRDNAIELEQSQRELSEKNEQLIAANADLNTFVRVASHDLKSPLRGITILTEFVREDIRDEDWGAVEKHLATMSARAARMDTLLNSLLRYAKIGHNADHQEFVDTTQIVTEAFELQNSGRNFTLIIDSDLPTFRTIQAPLSLIFRNLFDNAIKHHDKDSGTLRVGCDITPEHYNFTVSDDGFGIEPQYHMKIFEAFQTLKSRDEVEGSGIGLSEVKKIIENLGGEIHVSSGAPNQRGCTFTFSWPIVIRDTGENDVRN